MERVRCINRWTIIKNLSTVRESSFVDHGGVSSRYFKSFSGHWDVNRNTLPTAALLWPMWCSLCCTSLSEHFRENRRKALILSNLSLPLYIYIYTYICLQYCTVCVHSLCCIPLYTEMWMPFFRPCSPIYQWTHVRSSHGPGWAMGGLLSGMAPGVGAWARNSRWIPRAFNAFCIVAWGSMVGIVKMEWFERFKFLAMESLSTSVFQSCLSLKMHQMQNLLRYTCPND